MRGEMTIQLEQKDLINTQQMEVTVNGPDGATHLIICTGVAELGPTRHETYVFFVGPQISRRQFVGAIASVAISTIQAHNKTYHCNAEGIVLEARVVVLAAQFDDEYGQVKLTVEVSSTIPTTNLAVSYTVNILAELSIL